MNTVTFTERSSLLADDGAEWTVPLSRILGVQNQFDGARVLIEGHHNTMATFQGVCVDAPDGIRVRDALRAWHDPVTVEKEHPQRIARRIVEDYHFFDAGSLSLAEPAKMIQRIEKAIREARGES